MLGTLAAGAAGGLVGFAIGRLAPTFVRWLYSPGQRPGPDFDPAEFGFGLGIVSGLFLGAGASLFLAVILVVRDMVMSRGAVTAPRERDAAAS